MASFKKIPANNKQGYKWICTIEGPPDPVTGKRTQIPRRADTQKKAEERCKMALDELLKHGNNTKKVKALTFAEVAQEWLETYSKGKVKRRTIRQREVQIKSLNHYFNKAKIGTITHRSYQAALNDLDDHKYSSNTISGVHVTANMIFKYAIKNKYRLDNPTIDVVMPKKLQTVEEIENAVIEEKYLNKQELEEFFKAVIEHGEDQEQEIFYLLAFSGMRSGELCSLKKTDLNFELNRIRITKTMDSDNMRKYELTPPKTKGSVRTNSIDEFVMQMIKEHLIRQSEKKKIQKNLFEDYHDKGFIFGNDDGYPFNSASIRHRMARILKHTSIKKKATPHIFRHTYVSMLAEAGVDLKTIMARVGHDDEKTTLNIYSHVTEQMQENADQKIKNYYKDILNLDFLQRM
ncbi:tyrosine-type recombinase/integrase [Paenibacillus pini]|uniref:Integrase n=1 Tax=Paenibacillus pini JCM 16418 TaxID=1236976 RepID=W7YQC4_9BACL|nr:site-specific integrase [Paenibacillus pini]GAF06786.1 integrase [Paenibacillus pini JCM 16418]